jgi:hypothetical protein
LFNFAPSPKVFVFFVFQFPPPQSLKAGSTPIYSLSGWLLFNLAGMKMPARLKRCFDEFTTVRSWLNFAKGRLAACEGQNP